MIAIRLKKKESNINRASECNTKRSYRMCRLLREREREVMYAYRCIIFVSNQPSSDDDDERPGTKKKEKEYETRKSSLYCPQGPKQNHHHYIFSRDFHRNTSIHNLSW